MKPCIWMFHGVDRVDLGDGRVTLTLTGWRYTSSEERTRPVGTRAVCLWCLLPIVRTARRSWREAVTGEDCPSSSVGFHQAAPLPQIAVAEDPCATRVVRASEWVESGPAGEMVAEHCGPHYTVVWHGRGWTVELKSGIPLWRVTA